MAVEAQTLPQDNATPLAKAPVVAAPADAASATHESIAVHEEGPTLLGLGAEGWVYTGVTIFIFIAFFVVKAHKQIAAILDQRIADARKTLDEAAAIRAEAETLLADAKKKQSAAASDAKAVFAAAESESANIIAKAEDDAKLLIERRSKMAEDNIAAAEQAAIADVRAKAASLATSAAEQLIIANHAATADAKLIDTAIAGLN